MFRKFGKVSRKELKKFVEKINIELPDDYKKFLDKSNGGIFDEEYVGFCMRGERNSIYMNEMLGLGVQCRRDLNVYYDEFEGKIPENMIIIGDTIETGKLLLDCKPENGGIYLWDSDTVLRQSNEKNCIYKVADSFEEFWQKLHKIA